MKQSEQAFYSILFSDFVPEREASDESQNIRPMPHEDFRNSWNRQIVDRKFIDLKQSVLVISATPSPLKR